ncbi:MAG TPA: sigma-54 dependent transcriptional regulator [Polyangiaceae bacterium]
MDDLGHCMPPEDTGALALRAAMTPSAPRRSKSPVWLAQTGTSTETVIQQPSTIPPAKPITTRDLAVRVKNFANVSAESDCMQLTLGLLERLAPTDVAVTLMGETGTGKDVLAHAIHERSKRSEGPFVVLDCGALASSLAESEVLGHERGAFTGAIAAHAGAFERAQGGTLFLDEIGELPLELQPRLLRAIDNRHGRRVGGSKDRAFDVRIVAATNRDLRAEVSKGRFRQDLFFRIGAAIVPVAPLRERLADLPGLLTQLLSDLGRSHLQVTDQAYAVIRSHAWPGNVRELKNALACASAFVEQGCHELDAAHFESVLLAHGQSAFDEIERLPLGGQRLERIERAAILQTLIQSDGNKVRAAETLGIAVSTLYEKLKKYRLEEEPCDGR